MPDVTSLLSAISHLAAQHTHIDSEPCTCHGDDPQPRSSAAQPGRALPPPAGVGPEACCERLSKATRLRHPHLSCPPAAGKNTAFRKRRSRRV